MPLTEPSLMERVYIGLGSNLADPYQQLQQALHQLKQCPHSRFVAVSRCYGSDPLGPTDQPRYLNAVAALDTYLSPLALLDYLQQVEQQQGRVRTGLRWGPRTLDLDIVLFGQQIVQSARLQIPHYHLHARAFVLYPLAELVPEQFQLPDGRILRDLLEQCPFTGLEVMEALDP